MTDEIRTEIRGQILLIGFNRPDKKNAVTAEMIRALATAYLELDTNDALRCAVIHAEGDVFTAGLDLMSVAPIVQGGSVNDLIPEGTIDPWAIRTPPVSKPVLVAVQGTCLTLGIELILAADIAIGSEDARFSQREVGRGLIAFGGATQRMPEVFGWQNAMRYLLTGEYFDAQTALRVGLLQEIVEEGKALERTLEIAEMICQQAPLAVRGTLASARRARSQDREAYAADLLNVVREMIATEDFREGAVSLMQKRPPVFRGR